MVDRVGSSVEVDRYIERVFALVIAALARATEALLSDNVALGQAIVDSDQAVDDLTRTVERLVWVQIESGSLTGSELRHHVSILQILPELERSADLAEHIAQRALHGIGTLISPAGRGYIQRMNDVALEMWRAASNAFVERPAESVALGHIDEEIDILHDRLTREVAEGSMPVRISAEVTLLGRFYERLGDHAVNLARRIGTLPSPTAS